MTNTKLNPTDDLGGASRVSNTAEEKLNSSIFVNDDIFNDFGAYPLRGVL